MKWHHEECPFTCIPNGLNLKVAKSCPMLMTSWTIACQGPLSMGFSRQEYCSGLPFLLQEIFPIQGSNSGLQHCRQTLYRMSHQGSQEYWSRLLFFPPGDLPDPGIKPRSQCIAGRFSTTWASTEVTYSLLPKPGYSGSKRRDTINNCTENFVNCKTCKPAITWGHGYPRHTGCDYIKYLL